MLEAKAEAEDNSSRPSPSPRTKFWPRGQLVLEALHRWVVSKYDLNSAGHSPQRVSDAQENVLGDGLSK